MDIASLLQGAIGDQVANMASSQLGIDKGMAKQGIAMAVPFLLKAMNSNASSPSGAAGLANALDSKHDGSLLGHLSDGIDLNDGMKILGHVLGGKQPGVQNAIGKSTGLDSGSAGQLLAMAAPVVMGFLGQQKKEQGVGQDGIAGLLGSVLNGVETSKGNSVSGMDLGMIGKFLDQDGDGDPTDEIMSIGSKLLGSFFK